MVDTFRFNREFLKLVSQNTQLVAHDQSVRKSIGNYVLTCNACHIDKEQASSWLTFLTQEAGTHERLEIRKHRIETWIARHVDEQDTLDATLVKEVNFSTEQVFACLMTRLSVCATEPLRLKQTRMAEIIS